MTDLSRDNSNFIEDFFLGSRDAKNGIEHKPGMSESYDRGYATQKEAEAIEDEKTRRSSRWT